jgi:hypothetical protein
MAGRPLRRARLARENPTRAATHRAKRRRAARGTRPPKNKKERSEYTSPIQRARASEDVLARCPSCGELNDFDAEDCLSCEGSLEDADFVNWEETDDWMDEVYEKQAYDYFLDEAKKKKRGSSRARTAQRMKKQWREKEREREKIEGRLKDFRAEVGLSSLPKSINFEGTKLRLSERRGVRRSEDDPTGVLSQFFVYENLDVTRSRDGELIEVMVSEVRRYPDGSWSPRLHTIGGSPPHGFEVHADVARNRCEDGACWGEKKVFLFKTYTDAVLWVLGHKSAEPQLRLTNKIIDRYQKLWKLALGSTGHEKRSATRMAQRIEKKFPTIEQHRPAHYNPYYR